MNFMIYLITFVVSLSILTACSNDKPQADPLKRTEFSMDKAKSEGYVVDIHGDITNYGKLDDKEQRWMKDKDHKISRQIVNFAVSNQVSVIRLEQLTRDSLFLYNVTAS